MVEGSDGRLSGGPLCGTLQSKTNRRLGDLCVLCGLKTAPGYNTPTDSWLAT